MSLFKGGLFAGALFAGALLGSDAEQDNQADAGSGGGYAKPSNVSASPAFVPFIVSDPRLNTRAILNRADVKTWAETKPATDIQKPAIERKSPAGLADTRQAKKPKQFAKRVIRYGETVNQPKPAAPIVVALSDGKTLTIPGNMLEDMDEDQAMAILTILALA